MVFFHYARWHVDGYVPSCRKDTRKLISLLLITEERNFDLKWDLFSTQFMVLFPNCNKRDGPKAGSRHDTEQMLPELMAAGHGWLGCVHCAAGMHRGWCCWAQGINLLLLVLKKTVKRKIYLLGQIFLKEKQGRDFYS